MCIRDRVFIDYCLKEQLPFLFLTNNSGRTPRQAADHMLKIGYQGIEPKHFYTSAMAASDTMIRRFPDKKRAYMVGAEGLREALLNNGYELVDDQADLVFIGLDKEGTWEKYSLALRQVLAGAILVLSLIHISVAVTVWQADPKNNSYTSNIWVRKDQGFAQLTAMDKESSFIFDEETTILFAASRDSQDKKKAEAGEPYTAYYRISLTGGEAVKALSLIHI